MTLCLHLYFPSNPQRCHNPCPDCREAYFRTTVTRWLEQQQQQQLPTNTPTNTLQSPQAPQTNSTLSNLSTEALADIYVYQLEHRLVDIDRRWERQEQEIRSILEESGRGPPDEYSGDGWEEEEMEDESDGDMKEEEDAEVSLDGDNEEVSEEEEEDGDVDVDVDTARKRRKLENSEEDVKEEKDMDLALTTREKS